MALLCHRLFYALVPPPQTCASIGRLRDALGPCTAPVADTRLHLTLAITPDFAGFPANLAEQMLLWGAQAAVDPFGMVLDRIGASPHAVALRPSHCPPALAALSHQLREPLARARVLRSGWHFRPHVTLLYREAAPFVRPIAPLAWEVTDCVLIHSLVGETRHRILGRWPLSSRQHTFRFG